MTSRHPVLVYSLLRLALFIAPFLLLLALGVDVVWALLAAAMVSGFASLFLLSKQRDAVSARLATRAEQTKSRLAEAEAAEDAWDEAQRAEPAETSGDAPDAPGEQATSPSTGA